MHDDSIIRWGSDFKADTLLSRGQFRRSKQVRDIRDDKGDTSLTSVHCRLKLVKEIRDGKGDTSLSSGQPLRSKLVKKIRDDNGDTSLSSGQ